MRVSKNNLWWERLRLGASVLLTTSIATITTHAQLEMIEDFESGMGDFTFTQAGYGTGIAETVVDPIAGEGNQVLSVRAGDVNTNNLAVVAPIQTVADGGMGTLFFRLAVDASESPVNGTIAVSPLEAPNGWGDTNVLFNPNSSGGFSARDGGGYTEVVATRSNLTWYKVWYVINTADDTYSVYLQGGAFASPTMVAENFGFRKNAVGEDLLSILIYMNSGGAEAEDPNYNGSYYIDDLYLDTAAENLEDPVPNAAPAPNFILVQNFENGLGDTTFSQAGYGTGVVEVVTDPFPMGKINNQVLSVNAGDVKTNNLAVVTPIPVIPDNSFGTVFMRFAVDTTVAPVNGTLAISPVESPGGWGDTNVLFNTNSSGALSARDGGGYTTVLETRTDLIWYKAWYLINTAEDSFSLYIEGGEFTEPTLLVDTFAFRKDTVGEDLMSMLFYYNSGGSAAEDPTLNGTVYVDDIYVDTTTLNMSDPWSGNTYVPLNIGFIPRDTAPVLDGIKDGLYRHNYSVASIPPGQGNVDSLEDLSATFSAIHTADGIYIWLDVLDSELSVDSEGQPWHDEMIQFFIDGDRNAAGGFDGENDVAFAIVPAGDGTATFEASGFPAPPADSDFSGLDMFYIENEGTGRTAELFIPWEALNIAPRNTWEIGIEFQLNDDDDGDTRDSWITMASMGGGNNNTDEYSSVQLWANKRADVKMTSGAIVVDGDIEGSYQGSWYVCDRWTNPVSHPDTDARFKLSYDADNLYLFLEVTDDSILAGESEQAWHDDGLEIAFDGNNNKGGGFDGTDDVKLAFRLLDLEGGLEVITDGFPPPPAGADFSGLETAQMVTDSGWNLEIKLPWSVISYDPESGLPFGMELNVADDDDGGNRDGILTWSSAAGVNNNTDEFGTVWIYEPAETIVAETTDTILIDGEIDEAYFNSPWNSYILSNLPVGNDLGAVWVGLYDADNFYVIVDVIDDALVVDSGTTFYQDDGIEFFIDPSNDSSGAFDGVEDIKIAVNPQIGESAATVYTDVYPAPPTGTDFSGIEAAWMETDTGWRIEMKVPFTAMHLSKGSRGMEMAFDPVVNDDDGAGRETIKTWSSIGNTNQQTQLYGTVILGGDVQLPWAGANVGDSINSPWFGAFEVSENGWLNHSELLWLYVENVTTESSMWIYSLYLNAWVWSDSDTFPLVYNSSSGSWVYYFNIPDKGVWIYDYAVGDWVLNEE